MNRHPREKHLIKKRMKQHKQHLHTSADYTFFYQHGFPLCPCLGKFWQNVYRKRSTSCTHTSCGYRYRADTRRLKQIKQVLAFELEEQLRELY